MYDRIKSLVVHAFVWIADFAVVDSPVVVIDFVEDVCVLLLMIEKGIGG